jgi:hypothetical protein
LAFPTATITTWDNEKNHSAISDALVHPFSSCGGPTNFISHSCGRELVADEIAALEWSKLDQKKVRYDVFV